VAPPAPLGDTPAVIPKAIVHLINDLPIMVDLDALPGPTDRSIRCTNVRTVDGKRPSFVLDQQATFVFPLSVIRLIEAQLGENAAQVVEPVDTRPQAEPTPELDEEPDEDLLERIRSI
jgi:hypothetical protein